MFFCLFPFLSVALADKLGVVPFVGMSDIAWFLVAMGLNSVS